MRGDSRAKLTKIIDTTAIDSVCVALGLDHERIRAMNDGTGDIDPESAAWIDSEVLRLEAAGLLEMTETPKPEGIRSDDATPTAEAAELTVPEAGPQGVEDSREALRAIVEGVHARTLAMYKAAVFWAGERISKYDRVLFDVVRLRLYLALNLRRPLSSGGDMPEENAATRRDFIKSAKKDLRNAETRLEKSRGLFNFSRTPPPDPSGSDLYRVLVTQWCETEGGESELALTLGLEGIGRFLYPEMYHTNTRRVRNLDGTRRLAAAALLEVIQLAEEAECRSPLPCEAELAASEIRLRMELMLIMALGIAPPSCIPYPALLDYPDMPEAQRVRQDIVERLLREVAWLDKRKRACRRYKGRQTAAAFFDQLIDESGAEECRRLAGIMTWDYGYGYAEVVPDLFAGRGPQGGGQFPC